MTQDSIDPLQETRMLAAAALLEKETEDSDEMYKDLFPRLLSAPLASVVALVRSS